MGLFIFVTEVIYYSLFYKFATKDNLTKYMLIFSVSSFLLGIISMFDEIVGMFSFFIITYLLLRKFIQNISNADLIFLIIVMLIKSSLELLFILFNYDYILVNKLIMTIMMQTTKFLFIMATHKVICLIYKKVKIKWNENNFVIRHLFTTCLSFYVILVCLYIMNR